MDHGDHGIYPLHTCSVPLLFPHTDKSPDTRRKAVRLLVSQLIQEPQLEAAIVAFSKEALRQLSVLGAESDPAVWTQEEAARCEGGYMGGA